jgi:hypothetical protein
MAPGAHVPLFVERADENASAIVRDARPMSRAEIERNRALRATPPVGRESPGA